MQVTERPLSRKPLLTAFLAILLSACVAETVPPQGGPAQGDPAQGDPAQATSAAAGGTCTTPAAASANAAKILTLVNQARREAGLRPVVLSAPVTRVSQAFACEISLRHDISHRGNDGSTIMSRLARIGIVAGSVAENTADGYATPERTFAAWMDSSGHRGNILSPEMTQIGVGQAEGAYPTWVLDLFTPL